MLYCGILALGFIVYSTPADSRELERLMFLFIIGCALVTLIGWYIYLFGRFTVSGGPDMIKYFVGPFLWKNPMASYLILFLPMVIAFALEHRGIVRALLIALAIAMIGGLIITRSRAGWLSAIVAYLVVFAPALAIRAGRKRLAIAAVIVVAGLALGLAMSPKGAISRRVASISEFKSIETSQDQSDVERLAMLEAGIEVVSDYPLFGIGTRAWPAVRGQYLQKLKFLPTFPHNAYLRAAAETGIPGILLLCIALLASFVPLWRKSYDRNSPLIVPAIAAGLTAVFLHMAVDIGSAYAGIILPVGLMFAFGHRWISDPARPPAPLRMRIPAIILACLLAGVLGLRGVSENLTQRATALAAEGRLDSAKSSAALSAAINPSEWKARSFLAGISLAESDFPKAQRMVESALRRAPTIPELHDMLASTRLALGDTIGATASLNRAVKLARRGDPNIFFRLASVYNSRGDFDSAERTYIAAIDAMSPFVVGEYTATTAGFRYRSSFAWERLSELWLSRGDSTMSEIAAFNAEVLQQPRENDNILGVLGYKSPSPEITVVRLFEAIARADTAEILDLTIYSADRIPRFSDNITLLVNKILDVRLDVSRETAEVDVLLQSVSDSGEQSFSKSTILLIIKNGKWAVTFEGR